MLPPPPCSTLFPYTTLFRSGGRHGVPGDGPRIPRTARSGRRVRGGVLRCLGRRRRPAAFAAVSLDRKSTRLNSSHLGISYAVFCLKKKNITKPNCIICNDTN